MTYPIALTLADKQALAPVVMAAVGLLVYAAVLIFGLPSTINRAFFVPQTTSLYLASLVFLYLAYRPPGRVGTLTSFSATLMLFAAQLSGLWHSGGGESFYLLGGLLPMSDATAYYSGALQILEGYHANTLVSWRPLFGGVLATLLGLTQHNLQVTLSLFVLINAMACFFLARELQRSHGTAAGVVVLATLFMFYRRFIGTTMTENLGLALGAAGLAVFWRGLVNAHRNLCLLGLFLLTLALNARAGPFFILPALIVWGARSFRGAARFSQRFLMGGIGTVLLGFMANSLVFKAIGDPTAVTNANFAYSLYGLIVGGNWQTVFLDHPELHNLSEIQRTQSIYALIVNMLRADPLAFVRGCLRAWSYFLERKFAFAFVQNAPLHDALNVLSLVAFVAAYGWRRGPLGSFIIASVIGMALSVPFVPPWDAGMRPYAAAMPVVALLPALGLVFLTQTIQRHTLSQGPNQPPQPYALLLFTTGLLLLTIGGPLMTTMVAKSWHHHPPFVALVCPEGTEAFYVHKSPGSSVNLVANHALQETYTPHLRLDDFRQHLQHHSLLFDWDKELPALAREFMHLPPGTTIISTIDFKSYKPLWIVAHKRMVPEENGIIGVCASKTTNIDLTGYHGFDVFYADSIQFLREPTAGQLQWDPAQPAARAGAALKGTLTTPQVFTPFMLTISPPSGAYIMTQVFDFAAILQSPGATVVGEVVLIDGVDKTADVSHDVAAGTLTVGGGKTFRYRGLSSAVLGPGAHRVDVCLHLSDGRQVCDSALWKVFENTEP